ncbi:MAG: hypothetical protein CMP11_09295 [Zetaproteobacteria bacterium]|nr:hypothetical protein [Pseudobdellovibrionaceae bacterium]|tara:strand:+ start:1264 stop:2265 length:1002 start_codon:yes stop_codon:yes gene_type:complete
MKKIIIGALTLSAQLLSYSVIANDHLSIEDLKRLCHQNEQNTQIMPFTSTFSCNEQRTFYTHTGNQTITLENKRETNVKASLKDGTMESLALSMQSKSSAGKYECPVYEQMKATARFTVTINSCDQLDEIVDEKDFCSKHLEPVWSDCSHEMTGSPFVARENSQCEYEKTGVTKSCVSSCPNGDQKDKDQRQQSEHSSSSESSVSSESQSSSQASSSQNSNESSQTSSLESSKSEEINMGAEVKETTISKGFMHNSHQALEITSEVEEFSVFSQLEMKKGFVISKVNGNRTRNSHDLNTQMRKALNSGKVTVEYQNNEGEFKSVTARVQRNNS